MARKGSIAAPVARREQHAGDTRRAIVTAARRAFARDGYADASLDDIVARARLTKGALYHHFKSKRALLEAVYVDMEGELLEQVSLAVAATRGDAWTQMLAAMQAFFAASAEPEYVRIVLREAPLVLGHLHGREIDQAIGLGFVCKLVEGLRDEGMLPPLPITATARMLLAATSEMAVAMAYASDPELARLEGTQVVLAMLEGLRARARLS